MLTDEERAMATTWAESFGRRHAAWNTIRECEATIRECEATEARLLADPRLPDLVAKLAEEQRAGVPS